MHETLRYGFQVWSQVARELAGSLQQQCLFAAKGTGKGQVIVSCVANEELFVLTYRLESGDVHLGALDAPLAVGACAAGVVDVGCNSVYVGVVAERATEAVRGDVAAEAVSVPAAE